MVFVTSDQLVEELDIFGLEASDEILNELRRVCDSFSCNAEVVVTKWVAFSHSSGKNNLKLQNMEKNKILFSCYII